MANRATRKLQRSAKTKKQYQEYYNSMRKAGKQPMTFYHWKKSGRAPTYFKGTERTRPEARMRRSTRKRMGMAD